MKLEFAISGDIKFRAKQDVDKLGVHANRNPVVNVVYGTHVRQPFLRGFFTTKSMVSKP